MGKWTMQKSAPTVGSRTVGGPRARHRRCKKGTAVRAQGEDKEREGNTLALDKETLETLRNQVFGFDTYFVTGYEQYPGKGVLFKGNLRGNADVTYRKLKERLKEAVGDEYTLFLLVDKEKKPTVVVFPNESLVEEQGPVPEAASCAIFAACTLATTLNASGLALPILGGGVEGAPLSAVLPGALSLLFVYAAHEFGHFRAAAKLKKELALPFFVPFQQLGSLGSITRIKSILETREELFEIAIAGPLYGFAASFLTLAVGLAISKASGQGVPVQAAEFQDSLLVGTLGKILFGPQLEADQFVLLNPIAIAGWAGMVINAINAIPVGETDGGRLSFAMWGRQRNSLISNGSLLLLGVTGILSDLALYWFLFVSFLQRGPIKPQQNEISELTKAQELQAAGILTLALLVLLPFPFLLTSQVAGGIPASM